MVLLGIPDAGIPKKHKTSPETNKIGGIPDWPDRDDLVSPKCGLCGQCQSLIVQLYCPLEFSSYHRTLYVFACPNPPCWNMIKSWTVYRCQKLDSSPQQTASSSVNKTTDGVSDWGMDANEWGDDANDWGDDTNSWGEVSNDWGDGDDLSSETGSDWGAGSDKVNGGVQDEKDDLVHSGSDPVTQADDTSTSKSKVSDETEDSKTDDCVTTMEQMSINDKSESAPSEPGDSMVITESMPVMSDDEKSTRLKSFNMAEVITSDCKTLQAYYINVFDEPIDLSENDRHINKLLKDYQKREGFNAEDFMDSASSQSSGAEKYERTVLIHKDVTFHKFMKRIALCPEQCIRYEWNGSPLYNSVPSVDVPSRCTYCNSETVFELQLTPALVNHLRYDVQGQKSQSEGCAIEFGTVIIFTCGQSCWNDSDKFRTENKIVLPDPDQHLFK